MSFKQTREFNYRLRESESVKERYPNRVPVICESNRNDIQLKKIKYLVPGDLTIGQFIYVLRKQMTLRSEEAMFLLINNAIPPTAASMYQMYDQYHDSDGFLYTTVTRENTFG